MNLNIAIRIEQPTTFWIRDPFKKNGKLKSGKFKLHKSYDHVVCMIPKTIRVTMFKRLLLSMSVFMKLNFWLKLIGLKQVSFI